MIKSLLEFGLTRSAIIVLGLVVFCAAGLVAFSRLNIEAYPNPAPVILEITAQAAGLSAEEIGSLVCAVLPVIQAIVRRRRAAWRR